MLLLIGPFGADAREACDTPGDIALAVYAIITMLMLFAWRASDNRVLGSRKRLNVLGLVRCPPRTIFGASSRSAAPDW